LKTGGQKTVNKAKATFKILVTIQRESDKTMVTKSHYYCFI